VDRHGQKHPEVLIFHFVGTGFDIARTPARPGDLDCDLEFLYRAALKVEKIREDLGKVGPVIAAQVEEAMLGHRPVLDTSHAENDSVVVRNMLKFERKLREQLEELAKRLHSTKRELRLSPENIRNVVEVGLALLDQPPLREATAEGLWPDPEGKRRSCPVFEFPVLPPSWSQCSEGLEHPHTHVIRPIVFDHSLAVGRDDVVLCHLNHRLVQMFLRLLRAELWSQGEKKRLNRFTTRMVPDDALKCPAVIVHGRLLVLGGDNHRVHEEVIRCGGLIEKGRFSRMNVGETQAAWAAAGEEGVPGYVEDVLKELWPKISDQAIRSLEARMTERTRNLQGFLDERSSKEVADLTSVMNELARSIKDELAKQEDPQMMLDLHDATDLERNQREVDLGGLRARLAEIPAELARETAHLLDRYRDPKPRLFPVAVTFLVPPRAIAELERGARR
jgi:hypothetical protein